MTNAVFFYCPNERFNYLNGKSPNTCKWMDHKFRQHNEETLNLLDTMANNYTNTTEVEAEDKLAFTVQVLEEVAALFEEDNSSASWEDSTAEELHSCLSSLSIGSHSHKKKNSQLYFKRLSDDVLKKKVRLNVLTNSLIKHLWHVLIVIMLLSEPLASSLHTAN
uniref:Uncharacterized protein n=1 Tax=Maylandia zebra TaxID=106582 RepID=A0A3P9DLU3_9CICH